MNEAVYGCALILATAIYNFQVLNTLPCYCTSCRAIAKLGPTYVTHEHQTHIPYDICILDKSQFTRPKPTRNQISAIRSYKRTVIQNFLVLHHMRLGVLSRKLDVDRTQRAGGRWWWWRIIIIRVRPVSIVLPWCWVTDKWLGRWLTKAVRNLDAGENPRLDDLEVLIHQGQHIVIYSARGVLGDTQSHDANDAPGRRIRP